MLVADLQKSSQDKLTRVVISLCKHLQKEAKQHLKGVKVSDSLLLSVYLLDFVHMHRATPKLKHMQSGCHARKPPQSSTAGSQ